MPCSLGDTWAQDARMAYPVIGNQSSALISSFLCIYCFPYKHLISIFVLQIRNIVLRSREICQNLPSESMSVLKTLNLCFPITYLSLSRESNYLNYASMHTCAFLQAGQHLKIQLLLMKEEDKMFN